MRFDDGVLAFVGVVAIAGALIIGGLRHDDAVKSERASYLENSSPREVVIYNLVTNPNSTDSYHMWMDVCLRRETLTKPQCRLEWIHYLASLEVPRGEVEEMD